MDLIQRHGREFPGREVRLGERIIAIRKDPVRGDGSPSSDHGSDLCLDDLTKVIQRQIIVIVVEGVLDLVRGREDTQERESRQHGGDDDEGTHVSDQLERQSQEVDPGGVMQMDRVGQRNGRSQDSLKACKAIQHGDQGIVHQCQRGGVDLALVTAALDITSDIVRQLDGDVGRGQEIKSQSPFHLRLTTGSTALTISGPRGTSGGRGLLLLQLRWEVNRGGREGIEVDRRNVHTPVHGLD